MSKDTIAADDSISQETVKDLTLLYELALSTGQSLDLKKNCARFLKTLMSRKGLKYASVWLNASDNGADNNAMDEALMNRPGLELFYGHPKFWIQEKVVSASHPMTDFLASHEPFWLVASDEQVTEFRQLVVEKKIESGVFLLFRLGDVGLLKLYGTRLTQALSVHESTKLLGVIQSFTQSIKACLAFTQANREIQHRQETELELRQAESKLSEQLLVLSKSQQALGDAKKELETKNSRLAQYIKDIRKTQAQLVQTEKMSALGQMVAGVAHEINNPISFIHGNINPLKLYFAELLELLALYTNNADEKVISEMLEEIELDYILGDVPKILNSMTIGTQRIQEIVLSLRIFSRLDEAEHKEVDIHQGIDSTLMILQHRLKSNSNRPQVQVLRGYSNLPLLTCYPGQLNQVFMNILANAIDVFDEMSWSVASESDAVPTPTIWITSKVLNSHRVQLSFKDNGSGIPKDVQQQLFDPFFTTKPVGKGTGLGLSISYQVITERHGGQIDCLSTPGEGTEFLIELPVECVT